MSGLEKFQANEAWRSHFKNLLLVERKATPQFTEPVKQSHRFSLDITEDLAVILQEKKISRKEQNPNNTELTSQTEDLAVILQEKKISSKEETQIITESTSHTSPAMYQEEDKENVTLNTNNEKAASSVRFAVDNLETVQCYSSISHYDETVLEEQETDPLWQKSSDESFEALEKMCNKTASDPNSTLFQYLHSEQKDKIVESAKKRSNSPSKETPKSYDAEARALQRLLDELKLEEERQLENESPLKGVDVTALEDIEAPSRLWENTFTNETILQTSPVKMVGLLRPSTILEENDSEDASSEISSHMSFQSATKFAPSEVSTSCYETAHDSTASSMATNKADKLIEVEENQLNTCAEDSNSSIPNIVISPLNQSFSSIDAILDEASDRLTEPSENIDLIDLEKTFAPLHESPHSSILEDTISHNDIDPLAKASEEEEIKSNEEVSNIETKKNEEVPNIAIAVQEHLDSSDSSDSVIEIISDDDDDDDEDADNGDNEADVESDAGIVRESIKVKHENKSTKDVSSSTSPSIDGSLDLDDYKENYPELDISNNESLHFNDTMEEVAYMMEKGKQYLAAASSSSANKLIATEKASTLNVKTAPSPTPLRVKQNTFLISPKADNRYRSPSPMLHKQKPFFSTSAGKAKTFNSPRSTEKPIAKPKAINQFSKEMKPFPKLELFKKPTATSGAPTSLNMRHKEISTKHFSHIVSPIRAYIKTSTNTPLMFTINDMNKNPNSLNSLQVLENESRMYKPNLEGAFGVAAGKNNVPIDFDGPSGLPKKAYISSEFKHIVDERTPVTIPGGKQFQKHIETAMLPAVLRHEGKMKMPGISSMHTAETSTNATSASNTSRRTDSSLADLSLMSGDISMYTIKDARKF